MILGLHLAGLSSILGGINFITTNYLVYVLPKFYLHGVFFIWFGSILITSFLIVLINACSRLQQ
jgi:heme/copper-type cytochrome/quinol oxidase subunit 1